MEFKDKVIKIANRRNWTKKRRIDELLEIDATMYMYLGSTASKSDKKAVKKRSRFIYKLIKDIDPSEDIYLKAIDAY
jgi:hypothetical protein